MSCNVDPMKSEKYEKSLVFDIKTKFACILLLMNHAYSSLYNIRQLFVLSRQLGFLSFPLSMDLHGV